MYYIVIAKKNNEMCVITFLKARTLSRISSARVTFYIQNCFYSELLNFLFLQQRRDRNRAILLQNFEIITFFHVTTSKVMFAHLPRITITIKISFNKSYIQCKNA